MKKLRVLLVDDEIMIREGFKRLFDWEAHDCEVVGEAADGMDALTKIDTLQPDIAIMDINIPIMNGLKVIQLHGLRHPVRLRRFFLLPGSPAAPDHGLHSEAGEL